jgi:hypothetical protein
MEVGEVGWRYVYSSYHSTPTLICIGQCQGVAVGAGEIEEDTVRELERTRRKLEETETALAQALKENTNLRIELSVVKLASPSVSTI